MQGALPAAAEGPAPYYNGAPPDQVPTDLEGALALVDSIIWADRTFDQREQAIFNAWVQKTVMRARAASQMQQQGQTDPNQQAGLGSSSASDYDAFGMTGDNGSYESD